MHSWAAGQSPIIVYAGNPPSVRRKPWEHLSLVSENLHQDRRQRRNRPCSTAPGSRKPTRASAHTARSTSSAPGSVSCARAAARCRPRVDARADPAGPLRDWRSACRPRRTGCQPRQQGGRRPTRTSSGSKTGSTTLEAEVPPLRRFILAGGSPAGAALHVARTICRRAERAMVGLGPRAGRAGSADLRQPPVRSAVRHGARRESPGRRARTGVVSHDAVRGSAPTRAASGWRASTTRISRSPRTSCRPRCVRTLPPSTRLRGPLTTSRTSPGSPTPSGCACSTTGVSSSPRAAGSGPNRPPAFDDHGLTTCSVRWRTRSGTVACRWRCSRTC